MLQDKFSIKSYSLHSHIKGNSNAAAEELSMPTVYTLDP